MSDDKITDDDLLVLRDSLLTPKPHTITLALSWRKARAAFDELIQRRAEQAAGREHVERVVREEIIGFDPLDVLGGPAIVAQVAWHLARRVADRLSAPVLSEEDVKFRRGESDGRLDHPPAEVTVSYLRGYSEGLAARKP